MTKQFLFMLIGISLVASVTGCGRLTNGPNDQANSSANTTESSSASRDKLERKAAKSPSGVNRRDADIDTIQKTAAATHTNPNAGVGFADVIGVTEHWSMRGPRFAHSAESEFNLLSGPLEPIPPRDWSVEVDPSDAKTVYTPPVGFESVPVPIGSQRTTHTDIVFSVAPSAIVAVGQNATKRDKREVWNLMTGEKIGTITGLGAATSFNAISPDGHYFAGAVESTGFTFVVGVWDVLQKKIAGRISLGSVPFFEGIVIPRNDLLVAASDEAICGWELPTGEPLFKVPLEHAGEFIAPAFSPGGHTMAIVTRSEDMRAYAIKFFELTSGQEIGTLPLPHYDAIHGWGLSVQGMTFSADGQEFAAIADASSCSKLLIWRVDQGTLVDHMTFKTTLKSEAFDDSGLIRRQLAEPLVFFPGGNRLLAFERCVLDRSVGAIVWKLPGDNLRAAFPGNRRPLDEQHVTRLAASGRTAVIQIVELPENEIMANVEKLKQTPRADSIVSMTQLASQNTVDDNAKHSSTVNPEDVSWIVRPNPTPAAVRCADAFPLQLSSGFIQEAGVSAYGTGRVVLLRSKADNMMWKRIPSKNTSPQQLRVNREHANPSRRSMKNLDETANNAVAWIDVYDSTNGQLVSQFKLAYDGDLVSVSPDGAAFAVLTAGGSGQLNVYATDDGRQLMGLRLADNELADQFDDWVNQNPLTMIVSAMMSDASHVITLTGGGTLACWDVAEGKQLFNAYRASQPDCSPGGKYCGFCDGAAYNLVEIETGRLCGRVTDAGVIQTTAFHPDGTRLAIHSVQQTGYYISIVDLTNGTVFKRFPVPVFSSHLRWLGDDFILLDHQKLIDVKQEAVVWSYKLDKGDVLPCGPAGQFCYLADNEMTPQFRAIDMPDDRVQHELAGKQLTPRFVLQPGDACKLSFDIRHPAFDSDARRQAEKEIRHQLDGYRIKVSSNAPVTLRLSVFEESGESHDYEFERFQQGYSRQKVSLPKKTSIFSAAYLVEKHAGWKRTWNVTNTSFFLSLSLKKGESISEAVERDYRESVRAGFHGLILPPYVFAPESADGLETTALGPLSSMAK